MKFLGLLIIICGVIGSIYYLARDETNIQDATELQLSSLRLVVSTQDGSRFGSAVIFDETDDSYYALTNEHVLRDATGVQAIDYYQRSYVASIIDDSPHVSYDLAIIQIEKLHELSVLDFSETSVPGAEVRAVGYPISIFAISIGEIKSIEGIEHTVTFPVIHHSAFIELGSSGGALVNHNDEIIGINFAVYQDEQGYVESYAIPVERVQEYLNTVNYK